MLVLTLLLVMSDSSLAQGLVPLRNNSKKLEQIAIKELHDFRIEYHLTRYNVATPSMSLAARKDLGFTSSTHDRLQLIYPVSISQRVQDEKIADMAVRALARVDQLAKPHCDSVRVCLAKKITPRGRPNYSHSIGGVTIASGKTIFACLGDYLEPTLRHELFHARMTQLGITPKPWVEEGMADFVQYDGKFDQYYAAHIENDVILPVESILAEELLSDKNTQLRASSWAITYYLVCKQQIALLEVPKHFEEVDELEARRWIIEELNKQRNATLVPDK